MSAGVNRPPAVRSRPLSSLEIIVCVNIRYNREHRPKVTTMSRTVLTDTAEIDVDHAARRRDGFPSDLLGIVCKRRTLAVVIIGVSRIMVASRRRWCWCGCCYLLCRDVTRCTSSTRQHRPSCTLRVEQPKANGSRKRGGICSSKGRNQEINDSFRLTNKTNVSSATCLNHAVSPAGKAGGTHE